MKRSIAFLLSIVMLLSIAACGSMRESAQSVVEKAIQAVQKLDTEQMQKYWGTSSVGTGSDETSDLDVECVNAMLKNLTYEIVSSDEKDDTASVKVNFTNIDIAKALTDTIAALLPQVIASSLTGEEVDDSLFNSELLKTLNSGNYDKVTKEATIKLTLKDNAWVIDTTNSTEVFNAMLADINSVGSGLENDEDPDRALISEVEDWVVGDIWNDGICDMNWYYEYGTSATGDTLDPEFTIKQLSKAMEKKADYDAKMAALGDEYAEISELWAKVSEQIGILYDEIQSRGAKSTGTGLDVGLYNQYFDAFEDAVNNLD